MLAVGRIRLRRRGADQGLMFIMLKDFEEREGPEHIAEVVVGKLFGAFSQISARW